MATVLYLSRDDFRTNLHPNLWEDICDQLGVGPKCDCPHCDYHFYPETIEVMATRARGSDAEDRKWTYPGAE